MTTIALSPRLAVAGDSFRLTDSRSARWFVEALQLFKQFNETSSKETLRDARKILQRCVESYPQDLLPSFYLAIAESVLGDMRQGEAIERFEKFVHNARFEVSAAARYNLAACYIETYERSYYDKAKIILDQLIEDLRQRGAPIGIHAWFLPIYALFSRRRVRVEPLYYQALEALTYVVVHFQIWEPRWRLDVKTEIEAIAQYWLVKLDARGKEIKNQARFLGEQRLEIWAWHWNNVGTIHEALAANALRLGDTKRASGSANEAEKAFKLALEAQPAYVSAKSNLGRLYFEVFRDLDKAAELWTDTLKGAEDTDYTHYNLGLLRTLQGDEKEALKQFKKAPDMLERRGQPASWSGARRMVIFELLRQGRFSEALKFLDELAVEDNPEDQDLRMQINRLKGGAT